MISFRLNCGVNLIPCGSRHSGLKHVMYRKVFDMSWSWIGQILDVKLGNRTSMNNGGCWSVSEPCVIVKKIYPTLWSELLSTFCRWKQLMAQSIIWPPFLYNFIQDPHWKYKSCHPGKIYKLEKKPLCNNISVQVFLKSRFFLGVDLGISIWIQVKYPPFMGPTPALPNVLVSWGCTIQKKTLNIDCRCCKQISPPDFDLWGSKWVLEKSLNTWFWMNKLWKIF